MKLKIGENIRRLRRATDMTQEQLADKVGVACQSVSRWENGTTYPDIEFLPVLAGIFGVTVDELLGCEDRKKQELIKEKFREYQELCYSESPDPEAVVSLIRELRRDCMTDSAMVGGLWRLFGNLTYGAESLVHHPLVVTELRLTANEIMEGNCEKWLKETVVEYMSHIEDDDHIEAFLDKYATKTDLTKETLLLARYHRREQWVKADPLRQETLFSIVHDQLLNGGLWRRDDRTPCLYECLQTNTAQLTFIHNICGVVPDSNHPITGDGSVDIFVDDRINLGIRRACYLASTGDPEGAFAVLEDTVALLERIREMEDGSMLTCKGIYLEDFRGRIEQVEKTDKSRWIRVWKGDTEQLLFSIQLSWVYRSLTAENGWEWFDPIRNDLRFVDYVARVKMVVT